jgi:hypothetical protein
MVSWCDAQAVGLPVQQYRWVIRFNAGYSNVGTPVLNLRPPFISVVAVAYVLGL